MLSSISFSGYSRAFKNTTADLREASETLSKLKKKEGITKIVMVKKHKSGKRNAEPRDEVKFAWKEGPSRADVNTLIRHAERNQWAYTIWRKSGGNWSSEAHKGAVETFSPEESAALSRTVSHYSRYLHLNNA